MEIKKRIDKRHIERLKEDADSLHSALCTKFINFFLNNDPESIEVQDKIKEVSAKWKQYCHRNSIVPALHESVQKFCDGYLKEYREKRGPYIEVDHQQEALRIQKAKLELENTYEKLLTDYNKIPRWIKWLFNK